MGLDNLCKCCLCLENDSLLIDSYGGTGDEFG